MDRRLLVLYGSQTGTAQEVAERVGREGRRLHYSAEVKSMNDYDVRSLPRERWVVFVASTTGQGDEPDNMKAFWKFLLRRNLPKDSLSSLHFGVLALGDSGYQKYNFVGKKLYRRLLQLGGAPCLPLGLCDEQHDLGHDFVVDPWLMDLWNHLLKEDPLPSGMKAIDSSVLPPSKYIVQVESGTEGIIHHDSNIKGGEINKNNPFHALVNKCERVTSEDHFQDTRLIELDISTSGIRTCPGDVCNVQPLNLDENVDFFFKIFPQFDRLARISVLPNPETNVELPHSMGQFGRLSTIEDYVKKYFDIQSIPRRYFFELLAHFTDDETEKEKFREFNSAEGQQDLYDYCNRPRRNILETFYDFQIHSVPNIPLAYLFDLIPPIKPRSFSIASPASESIVELLVAVVRYKSTLIEPRKGLCSTGLSRLTPLKDKLPIWITSGTFKFPPPSTVPKIFVGPGTGIAPFRSYLLSQNSNPNNTCCALFFGCRGKEKDFYFSTEWSELSNELPNFAFFVAFSRDSEDKVYVQHLIKENSSLMKEMIVDKGGSFFIAGNAKNMPDQVRDALKESLEEHGVGDVEEYVKDMELKNRYQTETWS